MINNLVSGSLAVYLLAGTPNPSDTEVASSWVIAEHFPERECSVVVSETLPEDIPEELTEHLRVAKQSLRSAYYLIVRPLPNQ